MRGPSPGRGAQAQRRARAKMAAGSASRWVAAAAGRGAGNARPPLLLLLRGLRSPPARAPRRLLLLRAGLCAAGERAGPGRAGGARVCSPGRVSSSARPGPALTAAPLPPLPQGRNALPPPPPPPSTAARPALRRTITRCWGCPAPPRRRRSRRPITRCARTGPRGRDRSQGCPLPLRCVQP